MSKSNLIIKPLINYNIDEVLNLVSKTGFIPYNCDPKVSSLASIIEYQNQTSNFDFDNLIAIFDGELIIGVLFLPVFEMVYENKKYYCVQGASGYISPEYRGVFGLIVDKLIECYPNTFKLFMFSATAVHKSVMKKGFFEVCENKFSLNNYIIIKPFAFVLSSIQNVFFKKLISYFVFFDKIINIEHKKKSILITENPLFDGDYSLIEKDYYTENKDFIVPVWNKNVIQLKYLKTTEKTKRDSFNNTTFHFIVENLDNMIIGSLVARKIANFNRVVIVELHTITDKRKSIVNDLLNHLISKMLNFGYEAILFNGIGLEYESILRSNRFIIKKKTNLKAFVQSDITFENIDIRKKVKLYYSSDDTNF